MVKAEEFAVIWSKGSYDSQYGTDLYKHSLSCKKMRKTIELNTRSGY